jgi:hypothetical protein
MPSENMSDEDLKNRCFPCAHQGSEFYKIFQNDKNNKNIKEKIGNCEGCLMDCYNKWCYGYSPITPGNETYQPKTINHLL